MRVYGEILSRMLISLFGIRDKKVFLKYFWIIDICIECDNFDYVI